MKNEMLLDKARIAFLSMKEGGNVRIILEKLQEEIPMNQMPLTFRIIQYLAIQESSGADEPASGICYKCIYRASIAGDAHSSCQCRDAFVCGTEYGISKGWFNHPFNFDPVWLTFCNKFTPTTENK